MSREVIVDLYFDRAVEAESFYRLTPGENTGLISHEWLERERQNFLPSASIFVYDTIALAQLALDARIDVDPDCLDQVAEGPSGQGLLLSEDRSPPAVYNDAEIFSVQDRRQVKVPAPITPSWDQHDFALEYRGAVEKDDQSSFIGWQIETAEDPDLLQKLIDQQNMKTTPSPKF